MIVEQPIPQIPDVGDSNLEGGWLNRKVAGTLKDISQNGNDATSTTVIQNRVGAAFNGTSSVMQLGSSFNFANITVSGWFKTDGLLSASRAIFGIGNNDTNITWVMFVDADGLLTISHDIDADDVTIASVAAADDSGWHHAVGMIDGTSLRLFLDGVEVAASGATIATNWTDLNNRGAKIGRSGPANKFWKGDLRDVRVHSRVLTQSEITAMFRAGVPDPDLKAIWLPRSGTAKDFGPIKYDLAVIGALPFTRRGAGPFTTSNYLLGTGGRFTDWQPDNAGAFMTWVKVLSLAASNRLFSSSETGGADNFFTIDIFTDGKLRLVQRDGAGDTATTVSGDTVMVVDRWYHVAVNSDGSTISMCVNGSPETVSGTNDGDWLGDTSGRVNVVLGAIKTTSVSSPNTGEQSDSRYYSASKSADFFEKYHDQTQNFY